MNLQQMPPASTKGPVNEELLRLLAAHIIGAGLHSSLTMRISNPAMERLRAKALFLGCDYSSLARATMLKGWEALFGEDLNSVR
jgi:hypothetical protein